MSNVKAFKLALYNALAGIFTAPTVVTYGHHGVESSTELVMIRDVSTEVEPGPLATARSRWELIEAEVVVYVGSGEPDQRTVTERALDLAALIDDYLQDAGVTGSSQVNLGGAVIFARVTGTRLEETDDPDDLARGRFARVTVTISARARY